MYRYTDFDRQFVHARAAQFRDQLERNLAGSLTDDEFRPLRLQNGWYIQRHAPMLRVAVPYGAISSDQIRRWPPSPATSTAAMRISPPARTSSTTGSHW
jgi:sulfite reductase (NADPH) hemoprotein beta-component